MRRSLSRKFWYRPLIWSENRHHTENYDLYLNEQ
jgi:hypothetical protein